MAGKTEYKNKFAAEKYDRIGIMVPKGCKATIKAAADKLTSGSINGYVNQAINAQLKHDGFEPMQKQPEGLTGENEEMEQEETA